MASCLCNFVYVFNLPAMFVLVLMAYVTNTYSHVDVIFAKSPRSNDTNFYMRAPRARTNTAVAKMAKTLN